MADKKQVQFYLDLLRRNVRSSSIVFSDRRKNLGFIKNLGLSISDVQEILLSLEVENYSSGPDKVEPHHKSDAWVFGYVLDGVTIYIKVSLVSDATGGLVTVVISFHEAERPLAYPYGGER